jgi:hypothetical protein
MARQTGFFTRSRLVFLVENDSRTNQVRAMIHPGANGLNSSGIFSSDAALLWLFNDSLAPGDACVVAMYADINLAGLFNGISHAVSRFHQDHSLRCADP